MIDKITEIIEENQLTYYLGRTINGGIKTGKLAYSASKHFIDFSKRQIAECEDLKKNLN